MTAEPTYSTTKTGNTIVDGPLSEETYGQSILPAAAYTDPAEFAREQKLIFSAEWVWAGYAHWIANEGDVHPVEVAGKPLLMVRDGEGSVNVFHNSCRHRGMVVTQEPIEVTQRIQCAYHCWSYNLDGSLAAAPYFNRERRGAPSPEARQKLGLLPVPSAVWAGMIFVNLSPDPTPFEDVIGPLAERWSHIDFSRLHLAEERVFDLEVNWKLAVENFLDFYHLPFVHPQVGPVAASLDVDDVVIDRQVIVGGRYPRGAVGKAKKSEEALPFIGDVPAGKVESQDIFCVFPNALVFLEADWFQVIALAPAAVDRTVEHMAVFVDQGAAEPRFAESLKSLCDVLFHVNEQDIPFLYKLQAGRASDGANHTTLLPSWDQITAMFQAAVAQRMGYGA
ncbi:aromatic ring-hydroxylating dioxygenase subunit alpha [Kineosporia rhizophila]|uniref:aromatic ring-hydroxylating oxygenase subunit alpha n=1 Tax=Kineosporia rhizophila TaxID=84633 RepID=UPI001E32216D|nr:aromatic ring-hydroxylating dioxygenase subunit alpha [Kineosporia rhizophila]MCE0535349.1 aromatic ring-hydroxylating dioxygenase subunit alpha [Kineosporia rhizophila]